MNKWIQVETKLSCSSYHCGVEIPNQMLLEPTGTKYYVLSNLNPQEDSFTAVGRQTVNFILAKPTGKKWQYVTKYKITQSNQF